MQEFVLAEIGLHLQGRADHAAVDHLHRTLYRRLETTFVPHGQGQLALVDGFHGPQHIGAIQTQGFFAKNVLARCRLALLSSGRYKGRDGRAGHSMTEQHKNFDHGLHGSHGSSLFVRSTAATAEC